ncbi:hypothetical protein ACKWTF_016622 [Chironomus riparius]
MAFDEKTSVRINDMTELSIDDLSNDILLVIFNFLDKGGLKRAARVCQRWKELITNSKTLTQRLTLFFSTDERTYSVNEYIIQFNKFLETKAAEFPCRNLKARIKEPRTMEIWDHLIDSFIKFVKDPLKVYFSSVSIPVVHRYIETYASTLTHLILNYDSDENSIQDLPFEFPNLVSLHLNQTHIPKSLIAPNLKDFKYYKTFKNGTPTTLNFDEFVVKYLNLKKLDTCCIPELPHSDVKFQLTNLKITTPELNQITFKSFIISQQKSLKYLEIRELDLEYRDFVDIIIKHTRIESLWLTARYNTNHKPQETDDFNYSIKKLRICLWPVRSFYVEWPHAEHIIGLLNKFRGLEHLQLMTMDRIDMIFDQVDFSCLKIMELYFKKGNDLKRFDFAQIQLQNLEELKIYEINESIDVENLVKIASFCSNLKILNLGKLNYIIKRTEFIKLSHLEIIFKYSPNIVDFVIEGCANLLSSFMFNIKNVNSNLQRLKVGVYCDNKIPIMLAKLQGSKFVCDIHHYKIIGMKPTKWYEEEFDYFKNISDSD